MQPPKSTIIRAVALLLPPLVCCAVAAWLWRLPGEEREIATFATSLRDRTQSQVHNASLALKALHGQVIAPGQEFSFNQTVGPWTADRGYRKAPVSYSGERILDWGGGVCQASTTLYNAALFAGLHILERNRHHWLTPYAPPGQDAAVAYPTIDLRFRNNLDSPVRIAAALDGESLVVRLYSRARPPRVRLEREILAVIQPATVISGWPGQGHHPPGRRPSPALGQPGCEVAVYRVFPDPRGRRELVSRDTYPAQNRLIPQ